MKELENSSSIDLSPDLMPTLDATGLFVIAIVALFAGSYFTNDQR